MADTNNAFELSVDDDGIARVVFDRPGKSMNTLTAEVVEELAATVDEIASNDRIRGAVITSGKPAFCAGADLIDIVDEIDPEADPNEVLAKTARLSAVCRQLETCGKPVAAAINGTALGGGLEIALACHYRVCADEPKARLGQPEVKVGLMPGAGGTQRLPRLIGLEASLPLLLQGTEVSPAKAAELGIVSALVEPGTEADAAARWVREAGTPEQPWDQKGFRFPGGAGLMHPKAVQTQMFGTALLQKTTHHNYPAPIAIMSAVYEGSVLPMDRALAIESRYFAKLMTSVEARNMVRTLFVHKGYADKLVRRPDGVEPGTVRRVGILGAGMMGAGIAWVSARAGIDVVLLDTTVEKAERGRDYSRSLAEKQVERGRMRADEAEDLLARITATDDYGELAGCDYVVEAVFEDRDVKADVTARAEAVIPSGAIFGSNTSTLPITGLAEKSKRPEQFIGIHFFSPVEKMPLVEVIVGEKTGDEAIARTLDYVRQIRKTPIVVSDSRGFYTSRVFGTYTREGMAMLAEGVRPALIENVARHAGMPVGPLEVTDEVSLELAWKVMTQTKKDLGGDYVETPADQVLETMVEKLGRRGRRAGGGFYEYPADADKRLWPGLSAHFTVAESQPDPEQVRKRLLYVQALDAVRCLEEGVLGHPADGDVGAVFGWGFPPYTGGPFSLIESVGLQVFVDEAERLASACGERFEPPDILRRLAREGRSFYAASGAYADGDARSAA